jgi:hypothetical protein
VQAHVILGLGVLHEHLFILIIRGDFSCIDHWVSQDVGNNSDPESCDSISSVDLSVAIDSSIVSDLWGVSGSKLWL